MKVIFPSNNSYEINPCSFNSEYIRFLSTCSDSDIINLQRFEYVFVMILKNEIILPTGMYKETLESIEDIHYGLMYFQVDEQLFKKFYEKVDEKDTEEALLNILEYCKIDENIFEKFFDEKIQVSDEDFKILCDQPYQKKKLHWSYIKRKKLSYNCLLRFLKLQIKHNYLLFTFGLHSDVSEDIAERLINEEKIPLRYFLGNKNFSENFIKKYFHNEPYIYLFKNLSFDYVKELDRDNNHLLLKNKNVPIEYIHNDLDGLSKYTNIHLLLRFDITEKFIKKYTPYPFCDKDFQNFILGAHGFDYDKDNLIFDVFYVNFFDHKNCNRNFILDNIDNFFSFLRKNKDLHYIKHYRKDFYIHNKSLPLSFYKKYDYIPKRNILKATVKYDFKYSWKNGEN